MRTTACLVGATALALATAALPARAHHDPSTDLSAASGLSLSVPVAISVALPSALLVSGAAFTVVAVEVLAEGTVWVLERVSDGARFSLRFGAELAGASLVAAGTVVVSTVVAAGCVLSQASEGPLPNRLDPHGGPDAKRQVRGPYVTGEAIAFIPNELGRALLHDERITR